MSELISRFESRLDRVKGKAAGSRRSVNLSADFYFPLLMLSWYCKMAVKLGCIALPPCNYVLRSDLASEREEQI